MTTTTTHPEPVSAQYRAHLVANIRRHREHLDAWTAQLEAWDAACWSDARADRVRARHEAEAWHAGVQPAVEVWSDAYLAQHLAALARSGTLPEHAEEIVDEAARRVGVHVRPAR